MNTGCARLCRRPVHSQEFLPIDSVLIRRKIDMSDILSHWLKNIVLSTRCRHTTSCSRKNMALRLRPEAFRVALMLTSTV